jgi:multimeric flavodoxin WrbA
MKVIGINGSPHTNGNSFLVIKAFFEELEATGIDTELLQVGSGGVRLFRLRRLLGNRSLYCAGTSV